MGKYALAICAAVAAFGAGSAFGADQAEQGTAMAQSDRAVVRELQGLRREVRRGFQTLNNRVGGPGRPNTVHDMIGRVVRNTEVICQQYSAHQCVGRFSTEP